MKLFFGKRLRLGLALIMVFTQMPTVTWAAATEKKAPKEDSIESKAIKVSDETIVATVNGENLTMADLRHAYSMLPTHPSQPQTFEEFISNKQAYLALLERVVALRVITYEAKKEGLDKDPDVKKKIEECENAIPQKALLDKRISEKLSDEVLEKQYKALVAKMPKTLTETKISVIVNKSSALLQKTLKKVKDGATFAEEARKISEDATKKQGGAFNVWFQPSDFANMGFEPEAIKAIQASPKATTLPKVFPFGDRGYTIIRVEDKRPVTPPEFSAIKDELKMAIAPQYAPLVVKDALTAANITRFDQNGNPLPKTDEEGKEEKAVKAKEAKGGGAEKTATNADKANDKKAPPSDGEKDDKEESLSSQISNDESSSAEDKTAKPVG